MAEMLRAKLIDVSYNGRSILDHVVRPNCRCSLPADGTSIVTVPLAGTATVDGREVETEIYLGKGKRLT